ncbi:hypothetical protein R6Q59_021410 [Mikania micrantha]
MGSTHGSDKLSTKPPTRVLAPAVYPFPPVSRVLGGPGVYHASKLIIRSDKSSEDDDDEANDEDEASSAVSNEEHEENDDDDDSYKIVGVSLMDS